MITLLAKLLLSLRYRITVRGLEQLRGKRGVLVLPNHPAEIDPVIVSVYLRDLLAPRPIALEFFYHLPGINLVMRWVKAIPMPDMGFHSGPAKRRRVERALDQAAAALKSGDSILLYPSGRLSLNGEEKIGGASGAWVLLQRAPTAHLALVRTKGLFGSSFSKAVTGGVAPDLNRALLNGVLTLLKNLIFFTPRRAVTLEISFDPIDLPRGTNSAELNRYLERWYNAPEPEKVSLVPYHFLNRTLPELPAIKTTDFNLDNVPPEVEAKVKARLAKAANVSVSELKAETKLGEDLGFDSLTVAELLLWLDQEFEVTDVDLEELQTVGSVLQIASKQLGDGAPRHEFVVPQSWHNNTDRPVPELSSTARSVPEAFLIAAKRGANFPALGDQKTGVLSWSKILVSAIVIAQQLKKYPGDHIGLLFPASVGGSLAVVGSMLSGKVPVLLNWTAGKRAILHAVESTGVEKIITSRAFLDLVQVDLEFLEDRFLYLEDLKNDISLLDKLSAAWQSRKDTANLIKDFSLDQLSAESPAVVLFTSGSESLPKGVPLSHKNLLSNISAALDIFRFANDDVLLAFLPPFHSFGLTICTILPLVTGLKVAFWPNPNESRKIAKAIPRWRATLATGTPTFLRSIIKASTPEQLASLRFLVSGAERAPEELFRLVETLPRVDLLEGYGITECSPVVSVNRPGCPTLGVGIPLSSVKIAIVHPETMMPLPERAQGLILISGESVFSGYIGGKIDPFVEHDGRRWYNSGDLGYLDRGSLVITGRLKRFIKIAGEMVSLGAVEEALIPLVQNDDGQPTLAVLSHGSEGDSRPQLVVFTTAPLTIEIAHQALKERGFPMIVRISEIKRVEEIPLLGSGKTDYQGLMRLLSIN